MMIPYRVLETPDEWIFQANKNGFGSDRPQLPNKVELIEDEELEEIEVDLTDALPKPKRNDGKSKTQKVEFKEDGHTDNPDLVGWVSEEELRDAEETDQED